MESINTNNIKNIRLQPSSLLSPVSCHPRKISLFLKSYFFTTNSSLKIIITNVIKITLLVYNVLNKTKISIPFIPKFRCYGIFPVSSQVQAWKPQSGLSLPLSISWRVAEEVPNRNRIIPSPRIQSTHRAISAYIVREILKHRQCDSLPPTVAG